MKWKNERELDYENWEKGYPKDEAGLDCVEMTTMGEWRNVNCDQLRLFICQKSADIPGISSSTTTTTTQTTLTKTTSETPSKISSGGLAGIIIGSIFGLLVIFGIIYFLKRKSKSIRPETKNEEKIESLEVEAESDSTDIIELE